MSSGGDEGVSETVKLKEQSELRRKALRRQLNRLETDILFLLKGSPTDIVNIQAKHKVFQSTFELLEELDNKALDQLVRDLAEDDVTDREFDEQTEYRTRAETLLLKVGSLTIPSSVASTISELDDRAMRTLSANQEVRKRAIKLPKIEMRKFKGDLLEWLGFWAQFKKIHEDTEIHNSDKFWYLLQSLEPGTEPYEVTSAYPQTDENYPLAIKALKRRYGDEDLLLQVYLRQILSLVIGNANGKEKISFSALFIKLDSYLRALKLLNLQRRDPATWLFPLVESCLPEELRYLWQRDTMASHDGSKDDPPRTRLDILMDFMQKEDQITQRIKITNNFAAEVEHHRKEKAVVHTFSQRKQITRPVATLAGFHIGEAKNCIFCSKPNHSSNACFRAKSMSYEAKKSILRRRRLCFNCFGHHEARHCIEKSIKCANCGGGHHTVICHQSKRSEGSFEAPLRKRERKEDDHFSTNINMGNQVYTSTVCLQTLLVQIVGKKQTKIVRTFVDSGSQRSYILKSTAAELGLEPIREERIAHSLFGGMRTNVVLHRIFKINLKALEGDFSLYIEVRDHRKICGDIPQVPSYNRSLLAELTEKEVKLSDCGAGSSAIELMIGADLYGKLLTGDVRELNSGAVAIGTKLGWTLVGEIARVTQPIGTAEMNLAGTDTCISKLWELESIGVRDPIEVTSAEQRDQKTKKCFLRTVKRGSDGRYTVKLPWKKGHPPLASNLELATKRLRSTSRKLSEAGLWECYDKILREWESESFIERVEVTHADHKGHYLPHRAVIKLESLTTPVRPVFDASSRCGKSPSVNDCLHKGVNMIQLIPDVLLRFREKPVGFVADIRKAFQMIGVVEEDRKYLRFLWWKDSTMTEMVVYQHKRVPFGATCSPFILEAVLELICTQAADEGSEMSLKLAESFYVDNCTSSEENFEKYKEFRECATSLLKDAGMELRDWLSNIENVSESANWKVNVLGLKWDRKSDELFLDSSKLVHSENLTKRTALSTMQKLFDPVGFSCPATLPIKLMLQRAWINKLKWDSPLPDDESKLFQSWCQQSSFFEKLRIPRMMTNGDSDRRNWSLHCFSDASQLAYAAAVFLRVDKEDGTSVQLLTSKSRVAPVGGATINRLELLGCLIGTRLVNNIRKALKIQEVPVTYWSDSTTALAWIQRDDQWGTFVGNRTKEINSFTKGAEWRFVPGEMNPADLPSRGCTPEQLVRSRWWEGPFWLQKPSAEWPGELPENDEEAIFKEKSSSYTVSMTCIREVKKEFPFRRLVRITAWIRRFLNNFFSMDKGNKTTGELTLTEIKSAETALVRSIQMEAYPKGDTTNLKGLGVIKSSEGILRVKTRITNRKDEFSFRYPAVLPGNHPVIKQLIFDYHLTYCHAGVGFLVTKLRQKFWIVHSRRSVKAVITRCFRCRRLTAKPTVTEEGPLPEDRVRDAEPFEVIGIDLAGPLILKNTKKIWLVLFTCAAYRAVHFELVDTLSTKSFVKALGKFCEKFRRPTTIYTDNGTNFRGTDNLFKKLDWDAISKEEGVRRINWRFSCSLAPWWGGWWERLIRSAKDLMRRTLGKGSLNHRELEEVIKSVAEVMNGRPLTYISEDPTDLEPLTPEHFIHPLGVAKFPEQSQLDSNQLRFRYKYVQTLKKELRNRWLKEYLGMLVGRPLKLTRKLEVGELVVVRDEHRKRIEWPLARILQLVAGQDGVARVARIKTMDGEYTRPVQRLHPIELHNMKDKFAPAEVQTRSGRVVKFPLRL